MGLFPALIHNLKVNSAVIFFNSVTNDYCWPVGMEWILKEESVGSQIKMFILKSNLNSRDACSSTKRFKIYGHRFNLK